MQEIEEGREVTTADTGSLEKLARGEMDMMYERARRYPRNVKTFRDEVLTLATITQEVAEECYYALHRKDKDGNAVVIQGPSARFAEIVASCWQHNDAGARIVDDRGDFVVAQGVFRDLQRNTRIVYEVQRRITTSRGARYGADMIGVTSNAASSIALRNAILKGVPKALWYDLYEKAKQTAIGDVKTLSVRRANAMTKFRAYGITEEQVLAKLSRPSLEQVTPDDLGLLLGILNAIKEGDTTPEQAFAGDATAPDMMPKPKGNGETVTAPAATSDAPKTATSPAATGAPAAAGGTVNGEPVVYASAAQQKAVKSMVLEHYQGDVEAFTAFHERYMQHFGHSLDKTPAFAIAAAITWTAEQLTATA